MALFIDDHAMAHRAGIPTWVKSVWSQCFLNGSKLMQCRRERAAKNEDRFPNGLPKASCCPLMRFECATHHRGTAARPAEDHKSWPTTSALENGGLRPRIVYPA